MRNGCSKARTRKIVAHTKACLLFFIFCLCFDLGRKQLIQHTGRAETKIKTNAPPPTPSSPLTHPMLLLRHTTTTTTNAPRLHQTSSRGHAQRLYLSEAQISHRTQQWQENIVQTACDKHIGDGVVRRKSKTRRRRAKRGEDTNTDALTNDCNEPLRGRAAYFNRHPI